MLREDEDGQHLGGRGEGSCMQHQKIRETRHAWL